MVDTGLPFGAEASFISRSNHARSRSEARKRYVELGEGILQNPQIRLSAAEGNELKTLAQNSDPSIFWPELLHFGLRLKDNGNFHGALLVLGIVSESAAERSVRA